MILITGGTGFIGSNFVLDWLARSDEPVLNLDALTYAGNLHDLDPYLRGDARKIEHELGWRPAETFETGIRKTVQWYLSNPEWVAQVQSGAYRDWLDANYAQRSEAA